MSQAAQPNPRVSPAALRDGMGAKAATTNRRVTTLTQQNIQNFINELSRHPDSADGQIKDLLPELRVRNNNNNVNMTEVFGSTVFVGNQLRSLGLSMHLLGQVQQYPCSQCRTRAAPGPGLQPIFCHCTKYVRYDGIPFGGGKCSNCVAQATACSFNAPITASPPPRSHSVSSTDSIRIASADGLPAVGSRQRPLSISSTTNSSVVPRSPPGQARGPSSLSQTVSQQSSPPQASVQPSPNSPPVSSASSTSSPTPNARRV